MTISEILALPKTVALPAKPKIKSNEAHREWDVALSVQGIPGKLVVYVRTNIALIESFSIGLRLELPGQKAAVLVRVNGDHGPHRNPDKTRVSGPHIHGPTAAEAASDVIPGFDPVFARSLDPAAAGRLPDAWAIFCQEAGIAYDAGAHAIVGRMHATGSQMDLELIE